MIEKAEWEIIDAPRSSSSGWTLSQAMQAFLGKKWRWKLAGVAILFSITLALLTALSFIAFFIVLSGGAIIVAINGFRNKFFKAAKFSSSRNLKP